MSGPLLSVVVAWQDDTADPCLEALAAQSGVTPADLEVLLVGRPPGVEAPPAGAQLPGLVRLPAPQGRGGRSLPRLLGAGAARARAPWVAFTEACCIPAIDWAASLLDACRTAGAAAVGGAVEPAPGLSRLGRALALCDYAPFLRPFPPGALPAGGELPGNNAAFRREILPPADRLEEEGFWKTFHCRRLAAEGCLLARNPRPLVYTRRRLGPRELARRRLRHGRCFGAMRAVDLAAPRRALYALTAPLLPAVLTVRTARHLRAAGRLDRSALGLVPSMLAVHALWIAGEWIGNALGAGDACLDL